MSRRYKYHSSYHPRVNGWTDFGDEVREGLSYLRADVRIMFGAGRGLEIPPEARLTNEMLNFVRWMRDELDACKTVKGFYTLASIFDYKKKSLPLVMCQVIHGWMMKRRAELVEQ